MKILVEKFFHNFSIKIIEDILWMYNTYISNRKFDLSRIRTTS